VRGESVVGGKFGEGGGFRCGEWRGLGEKKMWLW